MRITPVQLEKEIGLANDSVVFDCVNKIPFVCEVSETRAHACFHSLSLAGLYLRVRPYGPTLVGPHSRPLRLVRKKKAEPPEALFRTSPTQNILFSTKRNTGLSITLWCTNHCLWIRDFESMPSLALAAPTPDFHIRPVDATHDAGGTTRAPRSQVRRARHDGRPGRNGAAGYATEETRRRNPGQNQPRGPVLRSGRCHPTSATPARQEFVGGTARGRLSSWRLVRVFQKAAARLTLPAQDS